MTFRTLFVVAAIFGLAASAPAQQRPTTQDAQTLLQTRPDLVAQLRDRIGTSGLTPEQVRARLKAEGYPENLLDGYLTGGTAGARDSLPGDDVFNAVRALGISDSSDVESLRLSLNRYQRGMRADSLDRRGNTKAAAALRADTAKQAASEQIFGLSIFRSVNSEFQPNTDGPVDANYKIGPGDKLVLILTGEVELAHTLDVTREGFIVIPQVGQLAVANLTLGQLESLLYDRLGKVYSGVRRGGGPTRFSISVAKLRSNQVFVVGDVEHPGSVRVSSAGTALSALYAAGGPTDRGSLRKITVRRSGKTVSTFDVYDYLLRGDASGDVRLENGDVLFVPVHGAMVRIAGEVTRPATYELKDGETLSDLVNAAGGFSATAGRQHVQIERITPPAQRRVQGRDRVLLDVASAELAAGGVPSLKLEAGDVVRVFPISLAVTQRVMVSGNVWLPGFVGIGNGLTLSEALRRAGGLQADTYLGQVLISRLESDSTRTQLRAALRDTLGTVAGNDLALRDGDEILVFSRTEFRPVRYIAIAGAVRKPGQFPYHDGITMRDLVLLAGGIQESALLNEAEIARLPSNRAGGVTANTMRVPLDSSYLFERAVDGGYKGPPGLPAPATGAGEVTLSPYDNVLILRQPDWHLQRTVTVTGEVKYPGKYTLANKTERVSDLLRRAGGLTTEANADGAYFTRRRGASSYQALSDSVRSGTDLPARVGIDLVSVVHDRQSIDDLLLQNGDSLDVPTQRGTIEIRGAVNSPTVVALAPGQKLDHYIRSAGGPSRVAEDHLAYVVQPNGKIESRHRVFWFFRSDPTPRAGATVFVPVKDTTETKLSGLQTISIVTSVLATILTTIAVIKR